MQRSSYNNEKPLKMHHERLSFGTARKAALAVTRACLITKFFETLLPPQCAMLSSHSKSVKQICFAECRRRRDAAVLVSGSSSNGAVGETATAAANRRQQADETAASSSAAANRRQQLRETDLLHTPHSKSAKRICFEHGLPLAPYPEVTKLELGVLKCDDMDEDNVSLHAIIGQDTPLIRWTCASNRWVCNSALQ